MEGSRQCDDFDGGLVSLPTVSRQCWMKEVDMSLWTRRAVVVAEQFSDRVGVFRRDVDSGKLLATETTYPAKMASCIVFARA